MFLEGVSIISWLSVLYALNGRKVTVWILIRYEKVAFLHVEHFGYSINSIQNSPSDQYYLQYNTSACAASCHHICDAQVIRDPWSGIPTMAHTWAGSAPHPGGIPPLHEKTVPRPDTVLFSIIMSLCRTEQTYQRLRFCRFHYILTIVIVAVRANSVRKLWLVALWTNWKSRCFHLHVRRSSLISFCLWSFPLRYCHFLHLLLCHDVYNIFVESNIVLIICNF